jgi:hypothetical protein
MEILGNSPISVTMNTYSRVLPEMQRDAAELTERDIARRRMLAIRLDSGSVPELG